MAMVLFLNALAACPALHQLIHPDAIQAGHECAVTMFAHGKVNAATVDVSPAPIIVPVGPTPQIEFSVFSPAITNLPQGRAPPAVSSPQV